MDGEQRGPWCVSWVAALAPEELMIPDETSFLEGTETRSLTATGTGVPGLLLAVDDPYMVSPEMQRDVPHVREYVVSLRKLQKARSRRRGGK